MVIVWIEKEEWKTRRDCDGWSNGRLRESGPTNPASCCCDMTMICHGQNQEPHDKGKGSRSPLVFFFGIFIHPTFIFSEGQLHLDCAIDSPQCMPR